MIKVGSGYVWGDMNPDPAPGHNTVNVKKHAMAKKKLNYFGLFHPFFNFLKYP